MQHTVLTVFDLEGNILMEDGGGFAHVADLKYEGIEFLNFGSQVEEHDHEEAAQATAEEATRKKEL